MSSAQAIVGTILVGQFKIRPEDMTPEATLADLDIDSLTVVELIEAVGEEVGVRISEHEVSQWHTIPDLVATVEAKLAQRSAEAGR
ncbi:acyl carrier protein [Actinosynnema sp. NPDC002837]